MTLDASRQSPRSGGAPRQLVVLLHGYGADGRDLIDLAEAWADLLPDAAFVAPHAPDPCGEAPVGRQWFPLTRMDPHELLRGADAAGPGLIRFLDAECAQQGVPRARLALMGFSQGCMMALHVALTMARSDAGGPAVVVGYSGAFIGDPAAGAVASPPPVLLIHGSADQVIPAQALFGSAFALADLGVPVEWHLSHGLAHGIDDAGLAHGGHFLACALRD